MDQNEDKEALWHAFVNESLEVLKELDQIIKEFKKDPITPGSFAKYGQVIDRIMGAAKTLGANDIGHLCELGKALGYKCSEISNVAYLNVAQLVLTDLAKIVSKLLKNSDTSHPIELKILVNKEFVERVKWLGGKVPQDGQIESLINKISS